MVYWGLTPQQQPGSYQGGEMMMKSVFWWRKPEYPEDLPVFKLNDRTLNEADSTKYLCHVVCSDLSDDLDIARQCRQLYAQGNMILRKFHMCNLEVKLTLFRSFCTPMYTSQLWWNYRKSSINKLYISFHNIFKLFIGFSKYESTGTLHGF